MVEACCLALDFDALPSGDRTEIGERGATLSGGQKQRINLARALYADKDVYLLDDPFSSLDSSVASQIFTKYVKGALRNKTVILISHAMQVHELYISACDDLRRCVEIRS